VPVCVTLHLPPQESEKEAPAAPLEVGDRIRHSRRGLGNVTAIGGDRSLSVVYDNNFEKTYPATSAHKLVREASPAW
jgi:hypothetical protein